MKQLYSCVYFSLRKVKLGLLEFLWLIDYYIALCLTSFSKTAKSQPKALIMPAANIDGGFGEDVMVAGLLNALDIPVTIIAPNINNKSYFTKETGIIAYGNRIFVCIMLTKILKYYSDYYVVGADILDGIYLSNKLRFRSMEIAHRMGVKVHVTGFSVREHSSSYFVKSIRKASAYINILGRDPISCQRLQKIVNVPIRETADIAFLCGVPSGIENKSVMQWINAEKDLGRKIIAYCPNTIQAKSMGLSKYINTQRQILKIFISYNCSVLFLYHDLRNYALNMNDKTLSFEISKSIIGHKLFIDDINDGFSLKSYIQLADFAVTGRMHFGISGYTMGLPMFGVSYYGKFEGLQMMFGLDPEKTLIPFDSNSINDIAIRCFVNNVEQLKLFVATNKDNVLKLALRNLDVS